MKALKTMLCLTLAFILIPAVFNVFAADQSICDSDTNVFLYDNGSLKSCQLKDDYETNDITCNGGSLVRFYQNGKLEACVLSESVTIGNNSCKEGGIISFYDDGELKSCTKQ